MRVRAMRYVATAAGDDPRVVELETLPDGHYRATVGEDEHEVQARELPDGSWSLLVDGRSLDARVAEQDGKLVVTIDGESVSLTLADERRLRLSAATGHGEDHARATVSAPMPGKVVRVLVKAGQDVAAEDGLVVVEAMKMENELRSPRAGRVVEVAVQEGQTVEGGAKLVVVE